MSISSEIVLVKPKEMVLTDLNTKSILVRATQIEDGNLESTSEQTEVTDAEGATITKIAGAKKGKFSFTNSLLHTGLLAHQFGTKVVEATQTDKITARMSEILEVGVDNTITLTNAPSGDIKTIYKMVNRDLAEEYKLSIASDLSQGEFKITDKVITLPAGVTGKFYIRYSYESEKAISISNNTNNIPESVGCEIDYIFKNVCTGEFILGTIIAQKAKVDPSQISLSLKSDGKHPISIDFEKDYCEEDADLFTIILSE